MHIRIVIIHLILLILIVWYLSGSFAVYIIGSAQEPGVCEDTEINYITIYCYGMHVEGGVTSGAQHATYAWCLSPHHTNHPRWRTWIGGGGSKTDFLRIDTADWFMAFPKKNIKLVNN